MNSRSLAFFYFSLLVLNTTLQWSKVFAKKEVQKWDLRVYTLVDTQEIRQVSAAASTYNWEGVISYAWQDPSLTHYADESIYGAKQGCSSSLFPADGNCPDMGGASPFPIVTPEIKGLAGTSKNSITWTIVFGTPDFITDLPANNSMSWVLGVHSLSVTIRASQNLRKIPMDTQTLNFTLHNINVPATAMKFSIVQSNAHRLPDPEGYTVVSVSSSVVTTSFSKNQFSGIAMQYTIARIADVYIFRFVLPLVIITILVLCLQFINTSSRTMSCFTIIATTTSFLFISSNSLPQLPYKTSLDNFFIFQYCIALFLGAWNIYSTNRVDRFKKVYIKTIVSRAKAAKAKAEEMAAAAKERAAKAGDSIRHAAGAWCPAFCCSSPTGTGTATADPVAESASASASASVEQTEKEREKSEEERLLARVETEFDLSQWEFYLSEGSEKTAKSFSKHRSVASMLSLSDSRLGSGSHESESFRGRRSNNDVSPHSQQGSEFDFGLEIVPEMVDSLDDAAPSALPVSGASTEAGKNRDDKEITEGKEVKEVSEEPKERTEAEAEKKAEADKLVKVDFGDIPDLIRGILEFHQLGLKFMDKKGDDEQLMADVQFHFDTISVAIFLSACVVGLICIFLA